MGPESISLAKVTFMTYNGFWNILGSLGFVAIGNIWIAMLNF